MASTLGALLQERAGAIAGRGDERALLRRLLEDDGPVVAYVHGLAGVGKSTLLHAFAADARAAGAVAVEVDAHGFPATVRAFLSAVSGETSLDAAAAALGARGRRVVLLVDTVELLQMLDRWLCGTFIPALPANVRVVLAGRAAPAGRWRRYGPLLRGVAMSNLPPEDAEALLRGNGVDEETARSINAVVHGHPLSLQLAAGALRDRPGLALEEIAAGPVGEELARVYLDGLDAPTRRALDAAAVTRRTTLALLEAMLPDESPTDAFERLRRLPFVELGAHGLVVHDTVREAAAAVLRAADPQEYWRLRAAAWSRLRTDLRGAPRRDLGRYTADMLYLIEAQAVREAFFPAAVGEQSVERAKPADLPAIEALVKDVATLRAWWEAVPEAFIVARDRDGVARGFACLVEPHDISPRLIDGDRYAGRWRAHLRREPPPRGQRALFLRWITGSSYVPMGALLLDVTRTYMEMRPELRRVYARGVDFIGADPSCSMVMGYLPLDREAESVCVDFGPASVDGWLAELGERELQVEPDGALAGRRITIDGRPVDLTRLESEVLAYLRQREGEAVERAALLRDVWGYDWTGGSNVVEVVVSALRRKLGAHAGTIETVRGVGYRLRPTA